jgi:AhpD family alkylhydroperoxidase
VGAFLRDLRAIASARSRGRGPARGARLDAAFRERLMLVVTAVNGCRYCSYAHARMALVAGLNADEVRELGALDLDGCPPDQLTAVLYAQHWADSDANPDPVARERFVAAYDPAMVTRIDMVLLVIRTANLLGNTFDAVLQKVTFGLWYRVSRR